MSGAPNGPLRGNKGTLFEGGTKVDAFIYSSSFKGKAMSGSSYGGLFHVSDWMPTVLSMVDVSYDPPSGYELDGVSHWSTMLGLSSSKTTGPSDGPRSYILYNYYKAVDEFSWEDGTVRAIRNSRYKLLETYENDFADTYDTTERQDDDTALDTLGTCSQHKTTKSGTYTSYLFDLEKDPYESTNLYTDSSLSDTLTELRAEMEKTAGNYRTDTFPVEANEICYKVWKSASNTIVPWVANAKKNDGYPVFEKKGCDPSLLSPRYQKSKNADDDAWKFTDDDEFPLDTTPTFSPTHKPTSSPTHKPTN